MRMIPPLDYDKASKALREYSESIGVDLDALLECASQNLPDEPRTRREPLTEEELEMLIEEDWYVNEATKYLTKRQQDLKSGVE